MEPVNPEQLWPLFLLAVMLIVILKKFGLKFKAYTQRLEPGSLGAEPEQFDGKVVELTGRVVYFLDNPLPERLKRKFTDLIRTKTKNPDSRNRYVHQRFLISSNQLRAGAAILVEHNVKYGKLKIRKGSKVRVKGEYLHTVKPGSRNIYGRIHKTHEPVGRIEVERY